MHSKAMRLLYDEHDFILKGIRKTLSILEQNDICNNRIQLLWLLSFFKEYGDLYHHKKEENVLFHVISNKDEMLGQGIVQEFNEHHENFRELLGSARNAMETSDGANAKKHLKQYLSDLQDHIAAENDELFVSAEQLLNEVEKEKMYFRFLDKDNELGDARKKEWEQQIEKLKID
jgi:hemerythrin-like domain-containing protein